MNETIEPVKHTKYRAMVSSDWNGCLSPAGPFDCFTHAYPKLKPELERIFKSYTGNGMTLGQAVNRVRGILPGPVTDGMMDDYLAEEFGTYNSVVGFMNWCESHDVLFMINTTGMTGYFQRVRAKELLPGIRALSANPLIRYSETGTDPETILDLHEIQDKGRNTSCVAGSFGIPPCNIMIVGDSGGDGPHFEWGHEKGATLVGCNAKPSLADYCRSRGIHIGHRIGNNRDTDIDIMQLVEPLKPLL